MVRVYTPKKIATGKEQAGNFGWHKKMPLLAGKEAGRRRLERPENYGAVSSRVETFLNERFVGKVVAVTSPRKGGGFTIRAFRIMRNKKGEIAAKRLWQGKMKK